MTRSTWADRLNRYGMLLRAPVNFITAQTYRQQVFEGMRRGEAFVRDGMRKISPSSDAYLLPLVLDGGSPAVCIALSSIALDKLEAEEARHALTLLSTLGRSEVPIRLIALAEPPGPHERRVRAWLQDQDVLPAQAQGRVDIVDGCSLPIPVRQGDLFVSETAHMARLSERLAERAWPTPVLALDAAAEALAPAIAAWPVHPSPWPERSRLGLGYRVLKPLVETHVPGRTCLFVHFDPGGVVDPYVVRYLAELKAAGLDVVLISSCDLDESAFAAAEPYVVAAVNRQNKGLDFAGWALALELFPALSRSERLIIANDSVYGPVGEFQPLLDRMARRDLDVWGVVESLDIERHFQSWFVCFETAALTSPTFAAFWSSVLPMDDKSEIIRQYEISIRRTFEAAELKVAAAVLAEAHGHATGNPTMDDWRRTLDLGSPFLKVQLLRDNPLETSLAGWADEVTRRGYPVSLIMDHLHRVKGPLAAALKAF